MEILIQRAFAAQAEAEGHGVTVAPRIPILYFGDLAAYRASPLRILTVAINPSSAEFPGEDPFRRFPTWRQGPETLHADPARYLQGLNDYFREVPYNRWFGHMKAPLEGFEAAFTEVHRNLALHTDFGSPVATNPVWGKIRNNGIREALLATGADLWHALVTELRPHLVLMSCAPRWLDLIRFRSQRDWQVVHTIPFGQNVVQVSHRTVELRTESSGGSAWQTDFVFCPPYMQPFGGITHAHLRGIGPALRSRLTHW